LKRRHFITQTTGALALSTVVGCNKVDPVSGHAAESPPNDPPVPEFVFIPEPAFRVVVTIYVPPRARVGEALRLRARRESIGKWQRVKSSTLPPDSLFFSTPGPTVEEEVAANLTWFTDPSRAMTGDTGVRSLALGMEREAVFKVPGLIKVWAVTAIPLRQQSNVVQVEVAR
jgi:hypothetical protein